MFQTTPFGGSRVTDEEDVLARKPLRIQSNWLRIRVPQKQFNTNLLGTYMLKVTRQLSQLEIPKFIDNLGESDGQSQSQTQTFLMLRTVN